MSSPNRRDHVLNSNSMLRIFLRILRLNNTLRESLRSLIHAPQAFWTQRNDWWRSKHILSWLICRFFLSIELKVYRKYPCIIIILILEYNHFSTTRYKLYNNIFKQEACCPIFGNRYFQSFLKIKLYTTFWQQNNLYN